MMKIVQENKKLIIVSLVISICLGFFFIFKIREVDSIRLNLYFFLVYSGMCGCLFLIAFAGIKIKFEYLAGILILVWGIVIGMVLPCGVAPDEKYHYMSSYEYSNRILGTSIYNEIGEKGVPMINVRLGDYEESENNLLETHIPNMSEYRKIAECALRDHSEGEMIGDTSTACIYPWYKYIPATLGITFARIIGLGKYGLIFMGRFFNLLFFVGCVFVSIRIIPKGKTEVLFFALIPFMIELAGSYSYDAVLNSLVILFVSICLYYIENPSKIKWWSSIGLLIIYLWFARFKGIYIAYIGLLCYALVKRCMLMTPKIRKKVLFAIGAVGFLSIVIMALYIYSRNGSTFLERNINIASPTGMPEETFYLGDFIERPYFMLGVVWDGLHKVLLFLIASNNTFPWVPYDSLSLWGITICCVLLFANERGEKYSKGTKAVCVLGIVVACILGFLGPLFAWTPAYYTEVWGMQPRYFLPAIFLLLVMLGSDEKVAKTKINLLFFHNIFLILNVVSALNLTMNG